MLSLKTLRQQIVAPLAAALFMTAGCSQQQSLQPIGYVAPPPKHDALYTPDKVTPDRLEYSPERDKFAPILTERAAYPTQIEANNAFARATYNPGIYVIKTSEIVPANYYAQGAEPSQPTNVHLFACQPGALDEQTTRILLYRGHVVHCATDFLDADQQRMYRATVNFFYANRAWSMQITHPPITQARWLSVDRSPTDAWWWVPFRDRYQ